MRTRGIRLGLLLAVVVVTAGGLAAVSFEFLASHPLPGAMASNERAAVERAVRGFVSRQSSSERPKSSGVLLMRGEVLGEPLDRERDGDG